MIADPLTDEIVVDSSATILSRLAREWASREDMTGRETVLDLQEALHAFEMQRMVPGAVTIQAGNLPAPGVSYPYPMSASSAARKGYWVETWSTAPQPVLADEFVITAVQPAAVAAAKEMAVIEPPPRRRRSRKAKEVPDVEPGEHAAAGDDRPALEGKVLGPDSAAGDPGDVSEPPGPLP